MAVVHQTVRGTRLRDWRLQQLPDHEGSLLAVQVLSQKPATKRNSWDFGLELVVSLSKAFLLHMINHLLVCQARNRPRNSAHVAQAFLSALSVSPKAEETHIQQFQR